MTSPRFGLPHLSEDAVAAFADGVLSAAAASRAQRHCSECVECADAVRGQRETAMMLRAAPAPALPSGLLDRLAGLPMSTPLPPPRSGLPTVLGADGVAMFVAHHARTSERADTDGAPKPEQPRQAHSVGHPVHRRGTLPMTMLASAASAAAVVAAGSLGGHVSTLAAAADRAGHADANVAGISSANPAQFGAAQFNGAQLNAAQFSADRFAAELPSAGLLSAGQLTAGQLSAGQLSAGQLSADVSSAGQLSAGQFSAAQYGRGIGSAVVDSASDSAARPALRRETQPATPANAIAASRTAGTASRTAGTASRTAGTASRTAGTASRTVSTASSGRSGGTEPVHGQATATP